MSLEYKGDAVVHLMSLEYKGDSDIPPPDERRSYT
jgi:hypothetical protein